MPSATVLFGRKVRALREAKHLSQEKLAELCDYHRNQIGRIERGEQTVSFEGIMRISFGLSATPSELFKLVPAAKRLPRKGEYSARGTKKESS